ncbi:MAG TPA: acyl-CoA dehydrogenase family protein [Aggregatilineales bacterium]|nr:acyl-CoA dehydrogenase family protein [Aggregatilineales bacterium]
MVSNLQAQTTGYLNPFSAEHAMFRKTLRTFIEREINPHVDAWEEAEIWPAHDVLKKLGDLGALGLTYEAEYGGMEADYWYTVVFGEELGRIDCAGVPMGIAVHSDMATPALAQWGTPELKRQYLEPAIRGDMVAAVAVTEPDAGSDVASIRTFARLDGDDYVINGAKLYITNGVQADWICLLARTSDEGGFRGMSLIVVPTSTPGFRVSRKLKKLGNHSSDTAELSFEDVRVPVSNRIGEEGMGFILQMQQFQKERLIGAIMGISGAERAVRRTIDYLKMRQTFGRPIIDNQFVHFKLVELITEIEMQRQFSYHCAAKIAAGEDVTREASMAKLKVGRLMREVADWCMQFHGGIGYMEETWVSRYYRDARLTSIGGGADEIMLGIIAKYEGILPPRSRA